MKLNLIHFKNGLRHNAGVILLNNKVFKVAKHFIGALWGIVHIFNLKLSQF